MVEPKPSFFEMQVEGTNGHAIGLSHAYLCIAAEAFDTVDVPLARSELVRHVFDSDVPIETDIHQPILTRPAVRINLRKGNDMALDNTLQGCLGADGNNLCVDHTLSLEQTKKDNHLPVSTTSASTTYSLRTKLRLIKFKHTIQGRSLLAGFSQSLANFQVDRMHKTKGDKRHFRRHSCGQIHGNAPNQLTEFSLTDSRTALVPVFSNISVSYRSTYCAKLSKNPFKHYRIFVEYKLSYVTN